MTQANQARNDLLARRMDEAGCDLVFVSSHWGCRSTHEWFQGRVFSRSGANAGRVVADASGRRVTVGRLSDTGYGTVAGLCGANCGHVMYPFSPGGTELPDREFASQGREFGRTGAEQYALTQRQRALERKVRAAKREAAAAREAGADDVPARLALGRAQAELRAFCADNRLTRTPDRERAYGVGAQPRALTSERHVYAARSIKTIDGFDKSNWKRGREYGAVYDERGRLVSDVFVGDDGEVRFSVPDGFTWKDRRVAHTHPGEFGGTFSSDDIWHLTDADLLSYEASCSEGRYVITRAKTLSRRERRKFFDDFSSFELDSNARRSNEVQGEFLGAGKDPTGADRGEFISEVLKRISVAVDEWLSGNAVKYGYTYSFGKRGAGEQGLQDRADQAHVPRGERLLPGQATWRERRGICEDDAPPRIRGMARRTRQGAGGLPLTSADFDVVPYKVLRYAYSCLRAGASPTVAKARGLAGVNERYLNAAFADAKAHGYVEGPLAGDRYVGTDPVLIESPWRVTSDGARFVDGDRRMAKARDFLGRKFDARLASAVSEALNPAI